MQWIRKMVDSMILPGKAVTVTRQQARGGRTEPMEPHAHVPALDPGDLADFLEGRVPPKPVLASAHSSGVATAQNSLLGRAFQAMMGSRHRRDGRIWVTPSLLNYQYPGESGFVVLGHVERVESRDDGIDIIMDRAVFHLPGLCRTEPIRLLVNAIIAGSYDAEAPFRPACRNCRHRTEENRCGAQPPPIVTTECCAQSPQTDWCPAHRSGESAVN